MIDIGVIRMSTRVVMTLLVRNEEDVIDENILFHYAQGVEFAGLSRSLP